MPRSFACSVERGDHVVGLEALDRDVAVAERLDQRAQVRPLQLEQVGAGGALRLVVGGDLLAAGHARVPDHDGRHLAVVGEDLHEHRREAEDRVRGPPVRGRDRLGQREERAVGERVPVDQEQLAGRVSVALRHRSGTLYVARRLGLGAGCGRPLDRLRIPRWPKRPPSKTRPRRRTTYPSPPRPPPPRPRRRKCRSPPRHLHPRLRRTSRRLRRPPQPRARRPTPPRPPPRRRRPRPKATPPAEAPPAEAATSAEGTPPAAEGTPADPTPAEAGAPGPAPADAPAADATPAAEARRRWSRARTRSLQARRQPARTRHRGRHPDRRAAPPSKPASPPGRRGRSGAGPSAAERHRRAFYSRLTEVRKGDTAPVQPSTPARRCRDAGARRRHAAARRG